MERTGDDTWDLAISVGATATMVAAGLPRPAGVDGTSSYGDNYYATSTRM